jgi:hypothetical protein
LAYRYSFTVTKPASSTSITNATIQTKYMEFEAAGKIIGGDTTPDPENSLIENQYIDFDTEASSAEFISALQSELGVGQVLESGVTMSNVSGAEI